MVTPSFKTVYKEFFVKLTRDNLNGNLKYVGTQQGLRLTADSLAELKEKIDSRVQLRAEIARQEFKALPRKGVAFNDYSTMYMETHEVNRLVSHVTTHGVNHYA